MSKCFWIGLRITETYIQMEQKIAGLSMIGKEKYYQVENGRMDIINPFDVRFGLD